jgi:hypothetical protein
MLFLRSSSRIDRIEDDDILQELKIFALKDKIKDNKVRWCQNLNRMSEDRLQVKANIDRQELETQEDEGKDG